MRALLTVLIILFSVSASAGTAQDSSADYLWQTRSPEFIAALCVEQGLHPRCRAIAWWGQEPCIVMTPAPPSESAPEIILRRWLRDLNHERRHCREKRNFHKGD